MRKIFYCLFIILIITSHCLLNYTYKNNNIIALVNSNDYNQITHLHIEGVLSYPNVLHDDNLAVKKLEESNLTVDEFKKILKELYLNNYMLISRNELYNIKDQYISSKPINMPQNKKPLLLSLGNIVYGTTGMVDKLIIERNDKLATYTSKRSINKRIHYDRDFITILNSFISQHPDFSYNNARATLVIDGGNGMFGYRTQRTNATSKYEIKRATEIINKLHSCGYEFACSGYKNGNFTTSNLDFASSLNSWLNYVQPIVDFTPIYFVKSNINDNAINNYNYKIDLLLNSGFRIITSYGSDSNIKYMSYKAIGYYCTNALLLNGENLRSNSNIFSQYFDCEKVYDHINRQIPFPIYS